jgi:hypothetical protein
MVKNVNKIIGTSLGVIVEDEKEVEIMEPVKKVVAPQQNNDYEYARRNLYDVIEKGQSALEDIIDIAKQSESARAFEVATNLMKTMVDANKDLLELAKKKKDLEKEDNDSGNKNVTNNNLFVGSSTELLKLIKNNE